MDNRILGFIVCVAVCIAVYTWVARGRETTELNEVSELFKDGVDHDTIYFRITDASGVKSFVHDSGIKPSKLGRDAKTFSLNVMKKEYNEGIANDIGIPVHVEYGKQIKSLTSRETIDIDHVKDNGSYYTVTVKNG